MTYSKTNRLPYGANVSKFPTTRVDVRVLRLLSRFPRRFASLLSSQRPTENDESASESSRGDEEHSRSPRLRDRARA